MKTSVLADNRKSEVRQSGRVLLIIEEAASLANHSKLLQTEGCEVFACDSYNRGAALVVQEKFDLVAVSQGGVSFEGREVVARALEVDRNTPVVVLARLPDMRNYLEAMQLGAVDYVEMPVAQTELTRVLRTHLRMRPAA
jgi:two-component system, NtrC family, C4-dicarboxylate transport response regulator DctD